MVVFVPSWGGSHRMVRGSSDIVAVHQVLGTNPARPVRDVVRELAPGSVFFAQQAPAPNTYLRYYTSLDEEALFPFTTALRDEFAGDRLSLIISTILGGASRTEPIEKPLPTLYCVHSGIIDEVHVETIPSRHALYERVFATPESIVFHDRIPQYSFTIPLPARALPGRGVYAQNRERL